MAAFIFVFRAVNGTKTTNVQECVHMYVCAYNYIYVNV